MSARKPVYWAVVRPDGTEKFNLGMWPEKEEALFIAKNCSRKGREYTVRPFHLVPAEEPRDGR